MASDTTASMDKLTCPDYVDFKNVKTELDDFRGPKTIPTTWIKNSKFSKKMRKDFPLVQNFTMGESEFNYFMRLRKELVLVTKTFGGE